MTKTTTTITTTITTTLMGFDTIEINLVFSSNSGKNRQIAKEQAGAELGQAQLPTGIWLYCD